MLNERAAADGPAAAHMLKSATTRERAHDARTCTRRSRALYSLIVYLHIVVVAFAAMGLER